MGRHKRKWREDWHHRVPDFKLVYCGTEKSASKKEIKQVEVADSTEREIKSLNLDRKN